MIKQIKHIKKSSVAKVMSLIGLMTGILMGSLYGALYAFLMESIWWFWGFLIFGMIFAPISNTLCGLWYAAIYNAIAKTVGGIKVEIK